MESVDKDIALLQAKRANLDAQRAELAAALDVPLFVVDFE